MHRARRVVAALFLTTLVPLGGCAAVFSGTSQTVRVVTRPEGGSVLYEGRRIEDGQSITVSKKFAAPQFNVGDAERPLMVEMGYSMDPWVLGDGAMLFVFVVPGLVGGGVDLGTGAWRKLDDPQIVNLIER